MAEAREKHPVAVEPVILRGGERALAVCSHDGIPDIRPRGEVEAIPLGVVCWDARRVLDWPLTDSLVAYDVKSLYGGKSSLLELATRPGSEALSRLVALERKMQAHARASATVRSPVPASQAAPQELVREWAMARAAAIMGLYAEALESKRDVVEEYEKRWPFILSVRQIELAGIHIDEGVARAALKAGTDPSSERCLRSMLSLQRDGLVTSLCNPMGGKTGRLRHEGGFDALAIPRGPARDAITSRFVGGKIASFDFNAIDYRCIVNSIGGEFAELYRDCQDFHARTTSFLFDDVTQLRRDVIKKISYTYIYGGSEETLVAGTGLSLDKLRAVLDLLDKKLYPIREFRELLWAKARSTGYVDAPGGRRLRVEESSHPGKVLGQYAQTYSSSVFEDALVKAHRHLREKQSKIIFTVHDEVIVDVHPDDVSTLPELAKIMSPDGYVVKLKTGESYAKAK